VLRDLADILTESSDPGAADLAARLYPFVHGAFAGLFDGPTTTRPDGHLIVFSLRDLPDEIKPVGTLLTLDAVWRHVTNPAIRRPRLVIVDEAWLLLRQPAGAEFLYKMAKSARKHWCGLTVASQDVGDVLGSDLGRAVVQNAATQILLRQAPQAIDDIVRAFNLSDGERQFLLTADRGQGLLSTGTQRVAFQSLASPFENKAVTTNPAELAAMAETDPSREADGETGVIDLDDPGVHDERA
jgi:type IV secretory pathway VirB4 component